MDSENAHKGNPSSKQPKQLRNSSHTLQQWPAGCGAGSLMLGRENTSRTILRQDESGVRSDAYIGLKRHSVSRFTAGEGVVAQPISKVRAVTLPVTIETHPPVARSR